MWGARHKTTAAFVGDAGGEADGHQSQEGRRGRCLRIKNNASGVTGAKRWLAVGSKRATIVPRSEILCEKLEADKGFLFGGVNTSDQSQLCLKSVAGGRSRRRSCEFYSSCH